MKRLSILLLLPLMAMAEEQPRDWFKSNAELQKLGQDTYLGMCASCHGSTGKGDAPAGKLVGARDFTAKASEWKNGTKVSSMFRSLTKGVGNAMASYESLPVKTRFALVHYIRENFVTDKQSDSGADLSDMVSEFSLNKIEKFEKIDLADAMKLIAEDFPDIEPRPVPQAPSNLRDGQALYNVRCVECHGNAGEGFKASFEFAKTHTPRNSVRPFSRNQGWYSSLGNFTKAVGEGRPGTLKPAQGDLSQNQFSALHAYVKFLVD